MKLKDARMKSRTQKILLMVYLAFVGITLHYGWKVLVSDEPRVEIAELTIPTRPVMAPQPPASTVPAELSDAPPLPAFIVDTVMLTVRSEPDRRSPRVRYLKQGDKVVSEQRVGRWVKIGEGEYVSSTYLLPVSDHAF